MIGTPLVRETTATVVTPIRQGPSRTFRPPVLIEVPTLPNSGSNSSRKPARSRVSTDRSRRRLRKEVRVAGLTIALGLLGTLAVFVWRSPDGSSGDETDRLDPVAAPFAIELEPPIPETPEVSDLDPQINLLPVAFPGYLLPGERDDDEEYGHARP